MAPAITSVLALALALLAGCGGAPVANPGGADGTDFELRVRRDGANVSARAGTSSATLAQRMTIRTPFVYWDERPHPAIPANQHLVLISVVIEPQGATRLDDVALQCDASILGQAWALVDGQRVRITPIDMDGPGAYSYADELLQAHDGGSGTPAFAQTAETRDGDGLATDYTALAGTVIAWAFGSAAPAQPMPGYAVSGAAHHDPDVGMAWGFLVPAGATEIGIGGKLLGTSRVAVDDLVVYSGFGNYVFIEGSRQAGIASKPLPTATRAAAAVRMYFFIDSPIHGLSYSPDGTRLAYAQAATQYFMGTTPVDIHDGCYWYEEVIHTNTPSGFHTLCKGVEPTWSADGAMLAFERDAPSGTRAIWIMPETGSDPHVLFDSPEGHETAPAWHPNGSRIAFASDMDGTTRLYTMAPDGSTVSPVGELAGTQPAWSFDGRRLAYERDGWVYVANADGSSERQITLGEQPTWSPSGQYLAFLLDTPSIIPLKSYRGPVHAVYIVELATGATQLLAMTDYAESNHKWYEISYDGVACKPLWE